MEAGSGKELQQVPGSQGWLEVAGSGQGWPKVAISGHNLQAQE
jgi:hypothetical protein